MVFEEGQAVFRKSRQRHSRGESVPLQGPDWMHIMILSAWGCRPLRGDARDTSASRKAQGAESHQEMRFRAFASNRSALYA